MTASTNPTEPPPAASTADAVTDATVADATTDDRRPCRGCGKLVTDRQRANGLRCLLDWGEAMGMAIRLGLCVKCAKRWTRQSRVKRLRAIADMPPPGRVGTFRASSAGSALGTADHLHTVSFNCPVFSASRDVA